MSSTFGGIQQAGSALAAARYGLNVVSQNIANADTPGYTRRTVQQASADPVTGVSRIHVGAPPPGGVTVLGSNRLNDPVVDLRAWSEHGRGAAADTTATRLSSIEQVFAEPSDTGLSEQLSAFWNSWHSVANDPGSTAPRAVLLQKAATVASTLNAMTGTMSGISASVTQSLTQTAASVTSLAGQLANLNGQIAVATASGTDANGLLDQRDAVLGQLSEFVGSAVTFNANGAADVTVGGQPLVTGATAATVALSGTQYTVNGTPVTLSGGSAAADLTVLGTTIPNYQSQLDAVAAGVIAVVNSAQASGYDLNGNPGAALFSGTGAGSIAVALGGPSGIAASASPGGALDGSNAIATAALATTTTGPDAAYVALVGDVGAAGALAEQRQATQQAVTAGVDAVRAASSGVNFDEEVSNMLTYQHAFSAASRVLTTIDDLLDTLINHTGLVGRG
jgi:flagellar hook-associated protein 1 FlgK